MPSPARLDCTARLLVVLAAACVTETQAPASPNTSAPSAPKHEDDAGEDDAGVEPGPAPCDDDASCDDGVFCNGSERCVERRCRPAASPPCAAATCHEPSKRCDCNVDKDGLLAWFCGGPDDDADGDEVSAMELGGLDCDDHDAKRYKGNLELCDYEGHDEDCDPKTVGSSREQGDPLGDRDGDGYLDVRCINLDPATQRPVHAEHADCDDTIREVHPGPDSQDFCDGLDNDCDGRVDEVEGSGVSFSAARDFCRDGDGDGVAGRGKRVRACGAPLGYIPCRDDLPVDCDDDDRRAYPGAHELCDGIDNDCDGVVDDPMNSGAIVLGRPTFDDGTQARCEGGKWLLACPHDRLWCDSRTALNGCETDATRLGSCRQCSTSCRFSCGEQACDEVVKLALGAEHSCAVTLEGRVACWGRGNSGQLGSDDLRNAVQPVRVEGLEHAVEVAAGPTHSCAVATAARSVYCWGDNAAGQLGTAESLLSSPVPVGVAGVDTNRLQDVQRVTAGEQHSCALLTSGRVACWGETLQGRLGDTTSDPGSTTPTFVVRELVVGDPAAYADVEDAVEVGAGYRHSCLLTRGGSVECWGNDDLGQLGDARAIPFAAYAKRVTALSGVTRIAVGGFYTCALQQGRVYCWGDNFYGQLGRGSEGSDDRPVMIAGLEDVLDIVSGFATTCARQRSGDVICWGELASLLLPAPEQASVPLRKLELGKVDQLALGGHLCFTDAEARVRCWGSNVFGQLGDGRTSIEPELGPVMTKPLLGSKP